MQHSALLLTLGLGLSLASLGCPSTSTINPSGGNGGNACNPGQSAPCTCKDGTEAKIECKADGSGFGTCAPCHDGAGGAGGAGGSGNGGAGGQDPCGDGFCAADEDCHTCDADCFCDPCTTAKSCVNGVIPPSLIDAYPSLNVTLEAMPRERVLERLMQRVANGDAGVRILAAALSAPSARDSLLTTRVRDALTNNPQMERKLRSALAEVGVEDTLAYREALPEMDVLPELSPPLELKDVPPGGTESCGAPLLRIRVARVTVHEEDDDFANDIVYCAVSTEGSTGAEARITPKTPNLDQGDSFDYSIDSGIIWGQAGPRAPEGNLLITYDCFEQDDNSSYGALIDALGMAATDVGGIIGGQYGWILETVGSLAGVVNQAVMLDGDDHLFNATHVVDASVQMELTNGKWWSVRKSGTHLNSDWDWELRVEAWGCAEYGTL